MSEGTPTASDPQVLHALHRVYIDSLPDDQRDIVLSRAVAAVGQMDVRAALAIIAASPLDQLRKWHVIASAIDRNPDLVTNEDTTAAIADVVIGDAPIDKQRVIERLEQYGKRAVGGR